VSGHAGENVGVSDGDSRKRPLLPISLIEEGAVERIVLPYRRRKIRRGTAFVLSGGGNRAAAQVGMLQALLERGILPDVLIGTSAGAMNAAAIALDPSGGIDTLFDVWTALRTSDVFPGSRWSRAWHIARRHDHVVSSSGLGSVIERCVDGRRFEDLAIPLRVVACDLHSGHEVVLAAGPVAPALLASAALPGAFPPVRHDGRLLVDGGVVNNVPLAHALAGPTQRVYVLGVASPLSQPPSRASLDVILRAFAIARAQRFQIESNHARGDIEVIVVPHPDDHRSALDFSGTADVIEEAYHLAAEALDAPVDAQPKRRLLRLRTDRAL
jgi:NTE family protein